MKLRFIYRAGQRILQTNLIGDTWADVPYEVEQPAPEQPAPEQPKYGWEVEAAFFTMTASTYGYVEEASTTNFNSDKTRRARCKLGFDDQGRVWMADTHAQYLARCLRDYARNWDAISEPSRETLKLAAHRLAGPEK